MRPDGALFAPILTPGIAVRDGLLQWRDGRCVAVTAASESDRCASARRLGADFLVVPAFHDGHTHVFGVGTSQLRPRLGQATSRAEAFELLENWLSRSTAQTPVIGEGWDESVWSDSRPPTRQELDRITDRPLALRRECGHVAVFNSAALALVGTDWPDLDVASGLAKETLPLSIPRLWPPTDREKREAVALGQSSCLAAGIVAIHEMGDPTTFRAFQDLDERGDLQIRVSHFFHSDHIETLLGSETNRHAAAAESAATLGPSEAGPCAVDPAATGPSVLGPSTLLPSKTENLRVAGMKFFLDGSFGGRSAWLRTPYPSASSDCNGISIWDDAELFSAIARCHRADWPVAAHAIGDRAIDQILRAVENESSRDVPHPGLRIEHAEYLTPDLLERAQRLPVHLSMQPNFVSRWQAPGGLYENVLGVERAQALNPLSDAVRSGQAFFGSDSMPLGPLLGLRGATEHPDPRQRLTVQEALRAYTESPNRGLSRPFTSGELRVGEWADFVVLSRTASGAEPSSVAAEESAEFFKGWEVAETWIKGECVFRDPRHSTVSRGKSGDVALDPPPEDVKPK